MTRLAHLTIDGFPLASWENQVPNWYFTTEDRVVRTRTKSQRNLMICDPMRHEREMNDIETEYVYSVRGSVLKERLEAAGFNRQSLEKDFMARREHLLGSAIGLTPYGVTRKQAKAKIEALRSESLVAFLGALRYVVSLKISPLRNRHLEGRFPDPLVRLLIGKAYAYYPAGEHGTGFPCAALENLAVAVLEVMPGSVECVLDVTDLVQPHVPAFDDITCGVSGG